MILWGPSLLPEPTVQCTWEQRVGYQRAWPAVVKPHANPHIPSPAGEGVFVTPDGLAQSSPWKDGFLSD